MIGGTYYVTAGTMPAWVWLACVPVRDHRHDGPDRQARRQARAGRRRAASTRCRCCSGSERVAPAQPGPDGRRSTSIVVALVAIGAVGPGVLLVAFALPRLVTVLKAYSQPKPAAPPPGYHIWPLWYVALAFHHNRLAGALFVLGLIVNVAAGW